MSSSPNDESITGTNNPSPAKRIVIFDDSEEALKRFRKVMEGQNVELRMYKQASVDEQTLKDFRPQLIIIDLVMGRGREDGYALIKDISQTKSLKGVPIIVCSKLINSSPNGMAEKQLCLELPGVAAAFGKVPNFPSADQLFEWIK